MSILTKIRDWFLEPLTGSPERERLDQIDRVRDYRQGDQRLPLKISPGRIDHNVLINLIGPVIDRTVFLLFGHGVDFDLPGEGESSEDEYLQEVWNLNKQEILLHKVATIGAEVGTCAIQLTPEGWYSSKLGRNVPRMSVVDTALMEIDTDPNDVDQHTMYTIQYVVKNEQGKDEAHKREVKRVMGEDGRVSSWTIDDYVASRSGKWQHVGSTPWEYFFPPIIAWQNLPLVGTPYGQPDITPDIIRLQDKVNFVASNVSKIIAFHAHPKTIGVNIGEIKTVEAGPDQIFKVTGIGADVHNLEMQSDLGSSTRYLEILRQALFDVTHTVDISSMTDKVGALTNFGLRVLYQDALSKLAVKRELYGDSLNDLNKYLLIMGGFGTDPDAGQIVWPEALVRNDLEENQTLQQDLQMGIVSKQTIAERRGYDWEQERIRKQAEGADERNLGDFILSNMSKGGF